MNSNKTVAIAFLTLALNGKAWSQTASPEVWLAPNGLAPQRVSAMDFGDLFTPYAPWQFAAAHTQVFKFYSGYLLHTPQPQIDAIVADLNRRGIAIAIEDGVMDVPHNPDSGCGGMGNVEGYGIAARATRLCEIVKSAHGEIAYLAMDEPLYYGHYFTSAPGKGVGCHSSIDEILRLAKPTLDAFLEEFPNIQIGDIEPTVFAGNQLNWRSDLSTWATGFRATMGQRLAFYDLDVEWLRPHGAQEAASVFQSASLLKGQHLVGKVGIFYNGTPRDTSDLAWVQAAQSHILLMEGEYQLHPDQVIFQSWNPYPSHVLPETAPDTMTSLVDFYFSPAVTGQIAGR